MHGVVEALIQRGVKYLTIWGFSTDNWKRSPEEVKDIFHLLQLWIEKDTPWLHENGVKLKHIGRFHQLPTGLQTAINQAVELTKNNNGMTLILAFNYSGRTDITDAVRRLITDGPPIVASIDERFVAGYLSTNGIPDVDLLIRTAGEFRLSNFMLWQTAYSEFYFTKALWPDFNRAELDKALKIYANRQRRFGGN
jgi:undecaprenyl diphosphate synthase